MHEAEAKDSRCTGFPLPGRNGEKSRRLNAHNNKGDEVSVSYIKAKVLGSEMKLTFSKKEF